MGKKIIFAQIGKLKPEKVEEYEALHANPWPGVVEMIQACNLHNYHIYREGLLLFNYFEYTGDDYEADCAKMAADPVTQEWWKHTNPCFDTYSIRPDVKFCADLKEIYYSE